MGSLEKTESIIDIDTSINILISIDININRFKVLAQPDFGAGKSDLKGKLVGGPTEELMFQS